jgi:predicted  nucleic acid-binding Zn-ribbon protein
MKAISKKIRQTGVNLLSIVFILSTVTPLHVHAADGADKTGMGNGQGTTVYDYCKETYPNDPASSKECIVDATSGKDKCQVARDAIKDAEKDALEACRKSGMGSAENCARKAMTCKDEAEDEYDNEEPGGVYAAANTIATLTGQSINSAALRGDQGGSCPQYGGKDYADRKESLDDKLKKLNEELAGLQEDISNAKSENSKENQRIQKEMNEAQEELEKNKSAAELQKNDDMLKQQENISKMGENIESLGMKKLDLENKYTQSQIDVASEMIKYSNSAVSVECLKQAQDYKAQVKALYKRGSGAGGAVASGKSINTAAAAKAKACVETFQKARVKIMTSADAQQKLIRADIDSTANKIANAKVQLDMATSNFNAAVEAAKAQQTKDEQALTKKMQLAVQEMNTLATKLTDDLTAIETKRKNLVQAIASVNQSMSEMESGGKPKSGTEMSVAEGSATVGDQINLIDRIMDDDDLVNECKLSSKYSTKKSVSKSSNRSTPKKVPANNTVVK